MDADRVPTAAALLGAAGALPFIAGAAGLWLLEGSRHDAAVYLLTTYAAVILSFMGAIHWGLAMRPPAAPVSAGAGTGRAMALAVLPALLAWFALSIPPAGGLVVMGLGFVGVYWMDARAIAAGAAPRWYRKLRIPLTLVVLACLAVAVAGLLVRAHAG